MLIPLAIVVAGVAAWRHLTNKPRRGTGPLGPEPTGDLPDTRFVLLVGALVWLLVQWTAAQVSRATGLHRAGGFTASILVFTGSSFVVALGLLPFALRGTRRPVISGWSVLRAGALAAVVAFAAQAAIGVVIELTCLAFGVKIPTQEVVDQARHAAGVDAVASAVAAIVLAPFAEEVFFRGILLPALAFHVGERRALVLQAIAFGAIHVSFDHPETLPLGIPLAVVGWGLGRLYTRTGTLAAPIAMHAAFNAINFVALRVSS